MKRYRVLGFDFDSRVHTLTLPIADDWEESVKEQHRRNKQRVEVGLIAEFGGLAAEQKRQNFIDLGPKPLSILAFHNLFLDQIRVAFVIGAYYPSLTAACALGERILNYLVLTLRDDFKGTPQYRQVYGKGALYNWDLAIRTLDAWGVLLPEVATELRRLRDHRTEAIHFRPELDRNDRALALVSIRSVGTIVGTQFSAFGGQPWFITGIPGEVYIKKAWETRPFVRRVYLPNCALLGPYHKVESVMPWRIADEEYEEREITDDEFCRLRRARRSN